MLILGDNSGGSDDGYLSRDIHVSPLLSVSSQQVAARTSASGGPYIRLFGHLAPKFFSHLPFLKLAVNGHTLYIRR